MEYIKVLQILNFKVYGFGELEHAHKDNGLTLFTR